MVPAAGCGHRALLQQHIAESVPVPEVVSACWAIPEAVRRAYDPRQWSVGCGGMPDDAWQKVWAEAERQGLIRHGRIGRAACHLFKSLSVVGLYRRWRQADPYGYMVSRSRADKPDVPLK